MKSTKRSKVEEIKAGSLGLRGNISNELADGRGHVSQETSHLLKFHGVYQQDDRDQRKTMRRLGQEKAYQFMVRTKTPGGGRLTPGQWGALDRAADLFGNGTMRLTSRQDVQFHGVGKRSLRDAIAFLNKEWVTTWSACGDGVRNTLACPASSLMAGSGFDGQAWASRISERFTPRSTAYYEIWLDGEKLTPVVEEPLYGASYLPRKFKIAISQPDHNCVDVYTNDVGLIPRLQDRRLQGFLVLVGGGMGSTHGKVETFPRLASPFTFVEPDALLDLLRAIVETHRDLGDRVNRRHARLKYIVEDLGLSGFRREVEHRFGRSILPSALHPPNGEFDLHLGWHSQSDPGRRFLGLFVENGRIADSAGSALKTGLRATIDRFHPSILLTPAQNLILADFPAAAVDDLQDTLRNYGIVTATGPSRLRRGSMACPALPTCGLAIGEAERILPHLLSDLEQRGYGDEEILIRVSGCPNSCSRPPVAEIGLVAKSVHGYNVYVGGSRSGNRLAELFLQDVPKEELPSAIGLLIDTYRQWREPRETFGDFAFRLGTRRLHSLTETAPRAGSVRN